MSSTNNKLRLAAAFAALATLALAVSCTGFFVNPTLTSISVSPSTWTINAGTGGGNSVQMSATANYNDGSTGTASVSWSIAPASGSSDAATISNGGLVTADSGTTIGSMTVTATALANGTLTATATINVQPPSLASITVTCTPTSIGQGATSTCTATGVDGAGNPYDITQIATWNSTATNYATVAAGVVTANSSGLAGTTNITASLEGITSSPAVTITVTNP